MSTVTPLWERTEKERRQREKTRSDAEKVAHTIETYGYELLKHAIEERLEDEKRRILKGSMDADDYHRACGIVEGLAYALARPDQFIRKARPLGDDDAT